MKLEARNVSVEFPGVKALSNVNFSIETGEIRAVVGANGAGKSTLMKVFAGANPNYSGDIYFSDEKVELRTPTAAKKLGVEIVYQEVDMALFPSQTVAENVMINKLIIGMKRKVAINWKKLNREAKAVLSRLHVDIDVTKLVSALSLAQKQMVLIARAIQGSCNFLILDEPTAPLSLTETERLFELVRHLAKTEKIAIIFITHRLQEIKQICSSITIMRNGEIVENGSLTEDRPINSIVACMLGKSFNENYPKTEAKITNVAFEVKDLYDTENIVNGVSLYARHGEIVGISGLVGAGKTELCKTIFGDRKCKSGQIILNGKEIKIKSPTDAVKNRIGLVPEERRKEGVLVSETVAFNLAAANLSKFSNGIWLSPRKQKDNANKYIESMDIKTPSYLQRVALLSGGNQQKVAVGKWLAADCDVYIFDEPTKGVDVGAKTDIFNLIGEIAAAGKCAIYITNEFQEILSISDRTYVMFAGKIVAELETAKTNESEIMFYATGGRKSENQREKTNKQS